jgi:hypothetical protein
MFISVDLPHPEGPTTVTNSRSAMSRSTLSKAWKGLPPTSKVRLMERKEIFSVIGVPAIR